MEYPPQLAADLDWTLLVSGTLTGVLGYPDLKKLYIGQAHEVIYLSYLLRDLPQDNIIISQIS